MPRRRALLAPAPGGSPDLPNFFRKPYGPAWALVGDAGLVMDPITGQGIGHAFRDAELLAGAVEAGLGGAEPLEPAEVDRSSARSPAARRWTSTCLPASWSRSSACAAWPASC